MKKFKFLALLMFVGLGLFVASCADNGETENDNNYLAVITFDTDDFIALIDSEQYGGSLLYSGVENSYSWTNQFTTLTGGVPSGYFWNGGCAISNYIDDDIVNDADYSHQLATIAKDSGTVFAVVYNEATLSFADGEPQLFYSIDVINTTYALGVMTYGNAYASALTEDGDYFTVIFTSVDNPKKTVEYDLARDGEFVEEWTTVDLTPLGKTSGIIISFEGNDASTYDGVTYLNTPAYVAIDNIAIAYDYPIAK